MGGGLLQAIKEVGDGVEENKSVSWAEVGRGYILGVKLSVTKKVTQTVTCSP